MDYKLNILSKKLDCSETGIQDIPEMKFGRMEDGTLLFNMTAYLKAIGNVSDDYRTFSRTMRFWIESLAKGYGVETSKLFWQNPDGDQLAHEILTHLFLAYTDPSIAAYYNDLVDDVMTNGMAFSDSFIMGLAQNRLTPDVINQLSNGTKKNSGFRQQA